MNRSIVVVYAAAFGAAAAFYLMFGVTPLLAVHEGYDEFSAAITTTVFMLATVGAELITSELVRRLGMKSTFAIGMLLMGIPVFALLINTSLGTILVVSALRGAGFALAIITSGAMVAALSDEKRLGMSLGIFGAVVGIPGVVALPLGVWLVEQVGFPPLLVVSGVTGLIGAALMLVPFHLPVPDEVHGLLRTIRRPAIARIAVIFAASTLASGVLMTWLPITGGAEHGSTAAALGLFAMFAAAMVTRIIAGRFGDRRDARRLLIPGLGIVVAGLLIVGFAPALMILGSFVFGLGLGILQTSTLQLMLATSGASGYGAVSALWNLAYDLGIAIGAFVFGVFASSYGVPLFVAAAVVAAAIALSAFATRSGSSASSQVTAG